MNTTIIDTIYPELSIQYILISGFIIISWGTFNLVSIISKLMYIYLIYRI